MKKILFGLLVSLWILSWWMKDRLPDSPGYLPELNNEPVQLETDRAPFTVSAGQESYTVTPKYTYELWGMVVSMHHTDSWRGRAHRRWSDKLNIKDICVVWGRENTNPEVYKNIDFSSGEWTCYFRTYSQEAYLRFVPERLSNNHVLTENPVLAEQILSASHGDIIHLKGYLSHYKGRKISRGTSTSRDDVGNGACETIYITDFAILHDANRNWEVLYSLSSWVILLWVLVVVFLETLPILKEFAGRR